MLTRGGSSFPRSVPEDGGHKAAKKILIDFFESCGGSHWKISTNWCSSEPLHLWHGIMMQQDEVSEISLPKNNLSGRIDSLWKINSLRKIDLSGNMISGEISKGIENLTSLEYLDLSYNQLTGVLPSTFYNLVNLNILNLKSNKFRLEISSNISRLTKLKMLSLGDNAFSGSIPDVSALKQLKVLNFQKNTFSGAVPESIGSLSNLEILNFELNNLSGNIPASIGSLTKLRQVIFRFNNLTGSIPDRLGSLLSLEVLYLDHNQLTGPIPLRLGSLPSIRRLNLSFNKLVGVIPDSFNSIDVALMKEINLANNALSGALPMEFTTMVLQSRLSGLNVVNIANNRPGFTLPVDILRLSGVYPRLNLSQLSLGGTLTDMMIQFFGSSNVDLSGNSLCGTLSLSAISYISSNREKGIEIDLSGNIGLELPLDLGQIGAEIANLDLSNCSLINTIPVSLDNLPQGSYVNLSKNRLTGELPAALVRLASIVQSNNIFDSLAMLCNPSYVVNNSRKKVKLDGNIGFTFPKISHDIAPMITSLDLSNSCLKGSVPKSLCLLTSARKIDISGNFFSGEIPSEVVSFICLQRSYGFSFTLIQERVLTLPDNTGVDNSCSYFDMSSCSLTGRLPLNLFSLVNLRFFSLEDNSFEGEIPPGLLKLIIQLRRDGNVCNLKNAGAFTFPENLSTLPYLFDRSMIHKFKRIDLSHCSLTGPIPASISAFRSSGVMELDLSGNQFTGLLPLTLLRLINLVSITLKLEGQDGYKCDYKTLVRYLLRDVALGLYGENNELETEVLDDPDKNLWKAMISSYYPALEDTVRRLVGKNRSSLFNAADTMRVRCLDVAHPYMALAIQRGLYYCARYEIRTGDPLHRSSSAILLEAKDRGYEMNLRKFFLTNLFEKKSILHSDITAALSEINLIDCETLSTYKQVTIDSDVIPSQNKFVELCTDFVRLNFGVDLIPTVAIKFFKSNEYFVRDSMVRSSNEFDPSLVIDLIKDEDQKTLSDAIQCYQDFMCTSILKEYPYVAILQQSGNNFTNFVAAEKPNTSQTKSLFIKLGETLMHLHDAGVMHGDFRGENVICSRSSRNDTAINISIIDFSASGRFLPSPNSNTGFKNENFGARYSPSAKLPPEVFIKVGAAEERAYLQYWGDLSFPEGYTPQRTKKGTFVPRVFAIEAVNMDGSALEKNLAGLPYTLTQASPLIDIWSFGVLILEFLGNGQRLIRDSFLDKNLALWSEEEISMHIIKKLEDSLLADLLRQILVPDPKKRLSTILRILKHPYFGYSVPLFNGKQTIRSDSIQLYRAIDDKRRSTNGEKLKSSDISSAIYQVIEGADAILRKVVFHTEWESLIPTCIVILSHSFNRYVTSTEDPAKLKAIAWGGKLAQLLLALNDLGKLPYFFDTDNQVNVPTDSETGPSVDLSTKLAFVNFSIRNLFSEDSEFFLYLVDEASMKLLIDNPIRISNKDNVSQILPLFMLSLRAIASAGGVEAIAEVLKIPCEKAAFGGWNVDSCVVDIFRCVNSSKDYHFLLREYDLLLKSVTPPSIASEDPFKARLSPLMELERIYANSGGTGFSGLRKLVISDSCVCWTKMSIYDLRSGSAVSGSEAIAEQTSTIDQPSNSGFINQEFNIGVSFDYAVKRGDQDPFEDEYIAGADTETLQQMFLRLIKNGVELQFWKKKYAHPKQVECKLEKNGTLSLRPLSKGWLKRNTTKRIEVEKIVSVDYGKRHSNFDNALLAEDDSCFSLITEEITLSFQTSGLKERTFLTNGFINLISSLQTIDPRDEPKQKMSSNQVEELKSSSPKFRLISTEIVRYSTDNDDSGPDGLQSVSNLGDDGMDEWNKWFSGSSVNSAVISVEFAIPQVVHRYSLFSANDCPEKNPKTWSLWGKASSSKHFEFLHEVSSEAFTDMWQEKTYDIALPPGSDLSLRCLKALELRITEALIPGKGIQLGQLRFFKVDDGSEFISPQPSIVNLTDSSAQKVESLPTPSSVTVKSAPVATKKKSIWSFFGFKGDKVKETYVTGDQDRHRHIQEHAAKIDDDIHFPITRNNTTLTINNSAAVTKDQLDLVNDKEIMDFSLGDRTKLEDGDDVSVDNLDVDAQLSAQKSFFHAQESREENSDIDLDDRTKPVNSAAATKDNFDAESSEISSDIDSVDKSLLKTTVPFPTSSTASPEYSDVVRKVVPYVVIATDGISAKVYPNRHAAPIPDSNNGHHGTGTILNVRARHEANDTSVWLLTNCGWVAENDIGNSNKAPWVDMYFDSPPIAVKVLRTSFVEVPSPMGWFEKRPPFLTMFTIELELPNSIILEAPEVITTDITLESLTTPVKEFPIIRIARSYAELRALDTALDMSASALGASFPEEFQDGSEDIVEDPDKIVKIVEMIDIWLKAVIDRVDPNIIPALGEFIRPTELDKILMQAALTSSGGLDGSWADLLQVLVRRVEVEEWA